MNLANNHALDYGDQGQAETIAALKSCRPALHGAAGRDRVLRQGGTKVAFVGFAPYPWAQDLLDIDGRRRARAEAARKADIVVVTMHAGAEGADEQHVRPGRSGSSASRAATSSRSPTRSFRAGADLVLGHGPHVLRGIEWYRGRVIAYSLGNFLGNGTLNVSGVSGADGGAARLTLRRDGSWVEAKLVPIQLTAGRPAARRLERSSAHDDAHSSRVPTSGATASASRVRATLLPPAWRTG